MGLLNVPLFALFVIRNRIREISLIWSDRCKISSNHFRLHYELKSRPSTGLNWPLMLKWWPIIRTSASSWMLLEPRTRNWCNKLGFSITRNFLFLLSLFEKSILLHSLLFKEDTQNYVDEGNRKFDWLLVSTWSNLQWERYWATLTNLRPRYSVCPIQRIVSVVS